MLTLFVKRAIIFIEYDGSLCFERRVNEKGYKDEL